MSTLSDLPTADDAAWFMSTFVYPDLCAAVPWFLTGSVAFREANEESDIDIVIVAMFRDGVIRALDALGAGPTVAGSVYKDSLHVNVMRETKALKINLLFLHPLDFAIWKRAGEMYPKLCRLPSRASRHAMFETLRAAVKASFALAGVTVTKDNFRSYL